MESWRSMWRRNDVNLTSTPNSYVPSNTTDELATRDAIRVLSIPRVE